MNSDQNFAFEATKTADKYVVDYQRTDLAMWIDIPVWNLFALLGEEKHFVGEEGRSLVGCHYHVFQAVTVILSYIHFAKPVFEEC